MKKNREIIDLIINLRKPEVDKFIAFMESPFFEMNKQSASLVKLLTNAELGNESFYSLPYLAKRLKKSEGTILNFLTHIGKAFKKFSVHLLVQENQTLLNKIYLDKLDGENHYEALQLELKSYDRWFNNSQNELNYRDKVEIKKNILYLKERVSKGLNNTGENENVSQIFEHQLELFLLDFFYYLSELEFRGVSIDIREMTDVFMKHSNEKSSVVNFSLSRLYVLSYELRKKPSYEVFCHLKDYFKLHIGEIETLEREKVIMSLYNFCLAKINIGDKKAERELYLLFRFADKNDFLTPSINPAILKSVVKSGLSQKDLDWVMDIVEKVKQIVFYQDYMVTYAYCDSLIMFFSKKYKASLNALTINSPLKSLEKIQFSILRMKCYFQLEDVDGLFREGKRLPSLIKDLPEGRKNYILNFRKYALLIYRNKNNDEKLKKVSVKIENMLIAEKRWLLSLLK